MKSIKKILETIFARISVRHKWQQDFLVEMFELIYSIQGRVNFENLSRYSSLNESTFRRNFSKFFDWVRFNIALRRLGGLDFSQPVIAAMDCSFISKSGNKTFGVDNFWSGVAVQTKKGLELSLLALINVVSGKAWALDATQTPAGLSAKEGDQNQYTRVDFYIEQILDLLSQLKDVKYFVADGYYAKIKIFKVFNKIKKVLITKLRPDANLRYILSEVKRTGKKGRPSKYAGKVNWKQLDLAKWIDIGTDIKYPHLHIYTQVLNSPHFKMDFKVVMLLNTRTNKYIVLASTQLDLDARLIVQYYQLRFQIEFLFRDAKQFTGLNHCQARSEEKLDFHFNMSLAAINLVNVLRTLNPTIKSMNSFVRKAYNTRLVEMLFSQLSLNAEFNLNQSSVQKVVNFGCLNQC